MAHSYYCMSYKKKAVSNTNDFSEELETFRKLFLKNDTLTTKINEFRTLHQSNEEKVAELENELKEVFVGHTVIL